MPLLPRHKAQAAAFRAQALGRGAVHPLRVGSVTRLTDDAVMVTFDVPAELRETYRFQPGQHVVLLHELDGDELRRSYSICIPSGDDRLCVAIKRVDAGRFSSWATQELRAGDVLRVMAPSGRFTPRLDARSAKHYVAIAAGSGITPVLSIALTILAVEPGSHVTLIYGNRTRAGAMFLPELEAEAQRRDGRLTVHLALSGEQHDDPLLCGRIDWARVNSLVSPETVDEWYLCGPDALMDAMTDALAAAGVPDDTVHREQFTAGARDAIDISDIPVLDSDVSIRLNGETTRFTVNSKGEPILAAALPFRRDVPYACRDGVCGTCRARVEAGQVVMERCSALPRGDRQAGYVLSCVAHPVTEQVVLDFDA